MICPQCDGNLSIYNEEGEQHACYHCGMTGYVDDEDSYESELESFIDSIASSMVTDYINHANEEDGFALHAAENMATETEYAQAKHYQYVSELGEEFSKVNPYYMHKLIDHVSKLEKKLAKYQDNDPNHKIYDFQSGTMMTKAEINARCEQDCIDAWLERVKSSCTKTDIGIGCIYIYDSKLSDNVCRRTYVKCYDVNNWDDIPF